MCERDGHDPSRRTAIATMLLAGSALNLPTARAATGPEHDAFMAEADRLKASARARGDGGYGAVVVRNGEIVGRGASAVISTGDPTAHAEMIAIREACATLNTRDLSDCVMYGTTRACPMCQTAAYFAKVGELRFGVEAESDGKPRYGC